MAYSELQRSAQELFEHHPTRFSSAEKEAFRVWLLAELSAAGYDKDSIRVIKHSGGNRSVNIAVGKPDAKYVFTAHYDTPGRTGWMLALAPLLGQTGANLAFLLLYLLAAVFTYPFTRFIGRLFSDQNELLQLLLGFLPLVLLGGMFVAMLLPMVIKNKNNRNDNSSGVLTVLELARQAAKDPELRASCGFVFFDNEEWGLLGSAQYSRFLASQKLSLRLSRVINLDCVGFGDIPVIASVYGENRLAAELAEHLKQSGLEPVSKKSLLIYMSDHASINGAVMLSMMKRSLLGTLYLPRIHTSADTVCDLEGLERLKAVLIDFAKNKNERNV